MKALWARLRAPASALAAYLPHLFVTLAFVVSRLFYRVHMKVQFDAGPLTYFIQYVPIWFLKHDFWRSIAYLHQQAPLQNVMAGGVWVLFGPNRGEIVLDGLYLAMGFTLAMSLLVCARRLGASTIVATVGVSLFIATPVAICYECWLFYHLPVVAFFSLSLWALLRFYERGTFRAGLLFFSLLAIVALFRSVYGCVWMIAVAGAFLLRPPLRPRGTPAVLSEKPISRFRRLIGPSARRTVVLAALVPTLVVGADALRTPLLMGRGFGSGMIWANLPLKVWGYVPAAEKERLKSEHIISDSVDHEAFSNIRGYPVFRVDHAPTGVPELDDDIAPDGQPNLQAIEYLLMIDKYYEPDGRYLLKHERKAYFDSILYTFGDWYCSSPIRDAVLYRSDNVKRLTPLIDKLEGEKSRGAAIWYLQVGLPLTLLYGVYRLLRPRARAESERSTVGAVLFMLITISYTGLATALISYGDFSRYRYEVDPFYFVLFMLLVTDVGRGIVRGVRRSVALMKSLVRRPARA